MAIVPASGTNIRLLKNIPFSSDYKATRWFDSLSSQTSYFMSKTTTHIMSEANFQRVDGKTVIRVNKSIDELWETNYLMFQNAQYNSKWFYAFVTKLEFIQKNTTNVHIQLDVFHTWLFQLDIKPSFIVREHCKLWNSDGSPVINTVDEGLNYGTEYDNSSIVQYTPNGGYKWLVMLTKTPMHDGAENKVTPTVIGAPQPLSVYLLPFKDDDKIPGLFLAKQNVGIALSKPTQVLNGLYTDDDAVNNVVGLYVTDFTGIPSTFTSSPDLITFPNNGNEIEGAKISGLDADGNAKQFNCLYVTKVLDFGTTSDNMGNKWTGYTPVTESKLMMYPYTQLVFDDFKGNRAIFKNEYINNPNLTVLVKGSVGTSNKVAYGIADYNFEANGLKNILMDETALINNEPTDIPIITDMLSAYLQGNRNSLATQKNMVRVEGTTALANNAMSGLMSSRTGNIGGMDSAVVNGISGVATTVLRMEAFESKRQDIANIPPQISKMGGNTSYSLGNNHNGVFVIKKQIKPEYIKKLTHFFNCFGYKVNEVKVPNTHTRRYWNYVQTEACTITGNLPNEDLLDVKAVFDNGITFWHTDDIGNYSLENEVI